MWSDTADSAGADEDRALSRLRRLRSDLIDPAASPNRRSSDWRCSKRGPETAAR